MQKVKFAERLERIPIYLFATLDRMKKEIIKRGTDLIDLSVGDTDRETPSHIVRELQRRASDTENQHYPSYEGLLEFRKACAIWYRRRFGVSLNPKQEVLTLIGAKDGISHLFWALVNPGDIVILPNPGYPVYRAQTTLTGGIPYEMPLLEKNQFLPDLNSIDRNALRKAKLLCLCYPNNPTGAVAPLKFFEEVIRLAKKYNFFVMNDLVYSELCYDGYRPVSLLQVRGAKDVSVEFHSLSKTYNMTGWRIGFAVGNSEIIQHLLKIKSNCDSGVFQAVQWAAIKALLSSQKCVEENRRVFQRRRDILVDGLSNIGMKVFKPKATFYVWAKVKDGFDSMSFTEFLLRKAGVCVAPGVGFGQSGEGYVRFAFSSSEERLKLAIRRISKVLK